MFRLNWFKLADGDFKLLPSFLNVQFKDDQGDISICDWVEILYQAKQIELLTKIYLHVNPNGNYLSHHNMDITLSNTQVTYWFMKNQETTKFHKTRDINFLKKHRKLFCKLQTDIYSIIIAMEKAHELNKKIASVYKNVSSLDAQDIFDYQQSLLETAANILINNGNEEGIKHLNTSLDAKENDISEPLDIIKDIENHPDKYNFIIDSQMPAFDWKLLRNG